MGATTTVAPGEEARAALVETGAVAYRPVIGPEVFAGGGFDVVFDGVGNTGSLAQALTFARTRGRVMMVGCAAQVDKLDMTPLWLHELDVGGAVGYAVEADGRHTYEHVLTALEANTAPVEDLVTHVFALADYRAALRAASNHRASGALKVVLAPDPSAL
jgi:threonine dehydrogenase-like Zn-dependent dehydrogenase